MQKQKKQHTPVLLKEILEAFSQTTLNYFIDATLGAGGHALALMEAHPEITTYFGIDQDPLAWELASNTLSEFKTNFTLLKGNATEVELPPKADGIMIDLGVSSMQFDSKERGFSFRYDAPLDMRMNPEYTLTAEEVVNDYSEKDLGSVFRDYGELSHWKRVAHAVVVARRKKRIKTTFELNKILSPEMSNKRKIHPMTLIYQALRICVNNELDVLKFFLPKALETLNHNGILAVISFHSLEDRIIKQTFQSLRKNSDFEIITKKPITPTEEEKRRNPRARSAKLRLIAKTG